MCIHNKHSLPLNDGLTHPPALAVAADFVGNHFPVGSPHAGLYTFAFRERRLIPSGRLFRFLLATPTPGMVPSGCHSADTCKPRGSSVSINGDIAT